MTPSMTPSTSTTAMRTVPSHPEGDRTGAVLPFVAGPARRFRREGDDAPRGRILLFTGVRYERLPDTEVAPLPKRRRS